MESFETTKQDEFTPEPESDSDEIVAVIDEHTIENIKAMQSDDDDPVHLARCADCGLSVKFRPNVTGTAFFLVDPDPDTTYGIGAHGRPVCPDGHGEMAIADDQLKPASEAFADAQSMLLKAEADYARGVLAPHEVRAVQGDLPGILPVFNYRGCYLELEGKAAEVDALHDDYMRAKEEAADAKKAWDKAAELYTKMALEFRRRRQAKGDSDAPTLADPPSRALACIWDKAHPDDACQLCTAESFTDRDAIVRVLGSEILPKEANGHADQVVTYRTKLDVAVTSDALDGVIRDVHPATIAEWSPEDRAAVRAWVADGALADARPAILGRSHVASAVEDGAQLQACGDCGAVLRTFDDVKDALLALTLVGIDCVGPQAEAEHHYPDTSKPKKSTRAKAEKAERSAAKKKAGKGRR